MLCGAIFWLWPGLKVLENEGSYSTYIQNTVLYCDCKCPCRVQCRCHWKASASTGTVGYYYIYIEGGSVNRYFQVGKVSRKARYGKNREETPAYLHGSWEYVGRKPRFFRSPVFEIALFCTRYSRL
jgi:hypothetical protein